MKRINSKGFSIIELLTVISIIGFLSSAVFATVNSARIKARDFRRVSDIQAIYNALTLYHQDFGKIPCHSWNTSDESNFLSPLVGKYLASGPKDPANVYNADSQLIYGIQTYKSQAGGPCGQIVELGVYFENMNSDTDKCPAGGVWSMTNHCHIFYPTPLPAQCPNNYVLEYGPNILEFYGEPRDWNAFCESLKDTPAENEY